MKKRKKIPASSESLDQVFGVLDAALTSSGLLLPYDEDDIFLSESEKEITDIELPQCLRDPQKTLDLGRKVLKEGFSARTIEINYSEASEALAQAARNGKEISQDILDRMHRNRATAEQKLRKT